MNTEQTVKTKELTPDQVFESNVFISDGNLFVGKGIPIKEADIARLQKWGIEELHVGGTIGSTETTDLVKDFQRLVQDRVTFSRIYDKCLKKVHENFLNFQVNNLVNMSEVKGIVDEFLVMVKKNSNILLNVINRKEVDTKKHFSARCVNVSILSMMIGQATGLGEEKLQQLGLGALLYDIGMLKIDRKIFSKTGSYTPEEYLTMKKHTILGYKYLAQMFRLEPAIAMIALEHHEQIDGKGYPRGLPGAKLGVYSKIVAIAQAFEGITRRLGRADKKKVTLYDGMKIILQEAANKYDNNIVRAFLSTMSLYPIGSLVILNDQQKAIVVGSNPNAPMRPVIKIIFDNNDSFIENGDIINLIEEKTLFIKGIETNEEIIDIAIEKVFQAKNADDDG